MICILYCLQESFTFTSRQMQLARYSPVQVIELAFFSANINEGPSKRFTEIQRFLEEAVKIVPIESVILAIGYAPELISEECTKLFLDSNPSFSPSISVFEGLKRALFRMRTGLNATWYDILIADLERHPLLKQPGNAHFEITPVREPASVIFPGISPDVPIFTKYDFKSCKLMDIENENLLPLYYIEVNVQYNIVMKKTIIKKLYSAHFARLVSDMKKRLPLGGESQRNGVDIDHVYPAVSSARRLATHTQLLSPLDVLKNAREKLSAFIEDKKEDDALQNEEMLALVKEVREKSLRICAELLGSFMEQRIEIPLLKDPKGTAELLSSKSSPVAIGCWALYSSSNGQLESMLSRQEGHPIMVEIADYISGLFLSDEDKRQERKSSKKNAKYNGKLQFLLLCSRIFTCSSEYVSYSLESQIARRFQFARSISLSMLLEEWDTHFKGDALSLVQKAYRPIIGRWLKWALLIYDLRESLAKYTGIGVTGLVNSGKSQLVRKLFRVEVNF